jgi:hypothetical protein
MEKQNIRLVIPDEKMLEVKGVREWLQGVETILNNIYTDDELLRIATGLNIPPVYLYKGVYDG